MLSLPFLRFAKCLPAICFVLAASLSFSQIKLEGAVTDKITQLPVPYAHVVVINQINGTTSNAEGIFRLELKDLTDSDSLLISHINYSPVRLSVGEVKTKGKIYLTERAIQLGEVTVKATDDYAVLEEIIQRTRENLGTPFTASVYYRELVKENSAYGRFADGILTVAYPESDKDMRVRVDQSRAYKLPKGEEVAIELPLSVKVETVLGRAYIDFLDRFREENKEKYHFYFQEGENPQAYHTLRIEPRKEVKRDHDKIYYFSTIKTDLNKNLREVEIEFDTLGTVKNSALGFTYELISARITLNFTSIQGKNYLSFIRYDIHSTFYSKRFKQFENYVTEVLLLDVKPGATLIARKDRYDKSSLYKAGTNHNSEFWKEINMPLMTAEEEKLLTELESKGTAIKEK